MAGKDRERRLARERHERQQARRAEARRRSRRRNAWVSAALATAVVVGGLGYLTAVTGGDEQDQQAAPSPTPTTPSSSPSPTAAASTCDYRDAASGKVEDVGTPPAKPETRTPYVASLDTNRGTVTVELDTAAAPCTVNSMRFLASKGYFDDTRCHRLTTEGIFVLQCGDPTATGQGGPGYEFDEENLPAPGEVTYPKGTVAMANAGPGTNGSQFFVVYKDTTLPPDYTIFGQVTKGLEVVEKVAAAGTETGSTDGPPKQKVVIRDVQVTS